MSETLIIALVRKVQGWPVGAITFCQIKVMGVPSGGALPLGWEWWLRRVKIFY